MQYITMAGSLARKGPGKGMPGPYVLPGTIFDDVASLPGYIALLIANKSGKKNRWWISARACRPVEDDGEVIPPIPQPGGDLYRTLHPYEATHDGFTWPARPDSYRIAPNTGSFDVNARLWTLPNDSSDGGAIKVTGQQWQAILKKNGYRKEFVKWAVGGTQQIMMWADNHPYPIFHYPLIFGGNVVKSINLHGRYREIACWPKGVDVPEDLPDYYWHRCWCVYRGLNPIRDAPSGIGHVAQACWMLVLGHSTSAWVYDEGLLRYDR